MAKSANKLDLQSLFWVHFDRRRTREMGGNADPLRRFRFFIGTCWLVMSRGH